MMKKIRTTKSKNKTKKLEKTTNRLCHRVIMKEEKFDAIIS